MYFFGNNIPQGWCWLCVTVAVVLENNKYRQKLYKEPMELYDSCAN